MLAIRTVKGIFPVILSSQPHPHTVRLAKHFAALWEIYGLEMTLCVCTEEQEKFPSKPLYLTDRRILRRAVIV